MTPHALVTGGTGMLGSYIVAQLRERGWGVTALVRSTARQPWLERLGASPAIGQLEDSEALARAADGCDVIFHAAAVIGSGGDWAAFHRGNVEGTANIVRAAEVSGAKLVHVSSTAVYGSARYRDEPTDESVPLPTLPAHDVYGRSKQEAEKMVLDAHVEGRTWAAVVRPPVMYGCRDRQFAPRVGAVLAKGFFPRIAGGRTTLALVHAGSVAEGAILAATTDAAGGRTYLLTNDHPVTVTDLVRCAEKGLGRRIWAPDVPVRLGRAGFGALKLALGSIGRGDLARHARGTLEMLTRDNPFTSDRARRELGWAPGVQPDVALTEAFRWWWDGGRTNGSGGG
jgi:nucleoside-diphosphate-sugar epimerase